MKFIDHVKSVGKGILFMMMAGAIVMAGCEIGTAAEPPKAWTAEPPKAWVVPAPAPRAKKTVCQCVFTDPLTAFPDGCICPSPCTCVGPKVATAKPDLTTSDGRVIRWVNDHYEFVGGVATAPACRTETYVGADGRLYERTVCPLKKK